MLNIVLIASGITTMIIGILGATRIVSTSNLLPVAVVVFVLQLVLLPFILKKKQK